MIGNQGDVGRAISEDPRLGTYIALKGVRDTYYTHMKRDRDYTAPTDDWPYLYVQKKTVNGFGVVI